MKKIHLILIGLLILSSSCRPKSIAINVDSAPPKLVAFTQVIPDNIMVVALSKSFSVLDGNTEEDYQNLLVSGATVQIKFNNQTFDFYELNPGIYLSYSNAYQIDNEYELIAYLGTDTIRSTAKMLPKVNFTNVLPIVEKLASDTNVYFNLEFNDPANISNWYLINIYNKQTSSSGTDLANYFQNGNNALIKSILISDKEFSGTYINKILVSDLHAKDSTVVTLSNINESYFNYLNFRVGGGNVFNQLNIEPVNYPTNITNGYGFFNTHFPDIKFFDLSKY